LPLYVISDHNGNPLIEPMPTNLNAEEYKKWLDDGVAKFNSGKKGELNFNNPVIPGGIKF